MLAYRIKFGVPSTALRLGAGGTGALTAVFFSTCKYLRSNRLVDSFPKELVDDIYRSSFKRQSGVSLKYMMDFGSQPIQKQLMISAQFLHKVRGSYIFYFVSICWHEVCV